MQGYCFFKPIQDKLKFPICIFVRLKEIICRNTVKNNIL